MAATTHRLIPDLSLGELLLQRHHNPPVGRDAGGIADKCLLEPSGQELNSFAFIGKFVDRMGSPPKGEAVARVRQHEKRLGFRGLHWPSLVFTGLHQQIEPVIVRIEQTETTPLARAGKRSTASFRTENLKASMR